MKTKLRLRTLLIVFFSMFIVKQFIDSSKFPLKPLDKPLLNVSTIQRECPILFPKVKPKVEQGRFISMEDYLPFYTLDPKIHHACPEVTRPSPGNIAWKKDVYQHVRLKFEDYPENDVYGLKFYHDDRFLQETGERHVRSIVTVQGPGLLKNRFENQPEYEWNLAMNRVTWYVLLWYPGFKTPVGVSCEAQNAVGLVRNASNQFYFQRLITCVLPEIGMLPESGSIVRGKCGKPTNNMEVVIPYRQRYPMEIGVCMASFYGELSMENIPYFVNWMETLNILGVSEVSINNASLKVKDDLTKKMFDFYQSSRQLTFTHFPPVLDSWESPKEDDAATEGINKIATGDCVYRNIKRYWYTLIIDLDEVPVPRNHDTYQDFILDYTKRHPNTSKAICLAMRSSFFYLTLTPGNPEYPKYLPILRQTLRFRVEPVEVDGVGMSKSFHNTRHIVTTGHHMARKTHMIHGRSLSPIVQHYTTEEDILVHHYRADCKYKIYCKKNWTNTIHDDIVPSKYSAQITRQVEHVLQAIGYI